MPRMAYKRLRIEDGKTVLGKRKRPKTARTLRMPHKRLGVEHGKVILKEKKRPKPTKITRTPAKIKELKKGRQREVRWKAWRQDANFTLGPDVLMYSGLTMEGRNLVGLIPAFGEDIKRTFRRIYRQIYNWIRDRQLLYVPEDTGKLRRSIMRYLSHALADIENYQLRIYLGTVVPYAAWVNEMPTYPAGGTRRQHKANYSGGSGPHLRHPPYVGGYTHGRAGNRLNDRDALHHFFNFMVANIRHHAPRIVNAEIVGLYRRWRSVFGWTHWSQCARYFSRGYR